MLWSDQYGEFATTYRPRSAKGTRNIGVPQEVPQTVVAQNAADALKSALKSALKESGKNAGDDVVEKIVQVYGKIAEKSGVTLSAIAQELGLSDRTVDEYVAILKSVGAVRRKDGKRFGTWEILM